MPTQCPPCGEHTSMRMLYSVLLGCSAMVNGLHKAPKGSLWSMFGVVPVAFVGLFLVVALVVPNLLGLVVGLALDH